ncbi:MAG TPA: DNA repair protein RecN [Acidobacteriota bacterium]|nr:DNA repair protein RecN [Acidobacteriota bacterium]
MIRFLRIRDFALIREVEIEFGGGLNLLTGETGSGKSILVDALGLLVGGRASSEMVRSNSDQAVLEGVFELEGDTALCGLLRDSGIEPEEDTLLIRREISSGGRGRVFINNTLATLALLKTVGERLADIHGQHDQKSLLDLSSHLEWLDRFGANSDAVSIAREHYGRMRELADRLDSMAMDEQERLRRVDILQFQIDEIRRANLQPQELEDLETERNILANREKVFALASEAYSLLYENETSLVSQSNRLERILQELAVYDTSWTAHHEVLKENLYKFEDLAYAARDYAAGMDFSPGRLDQVEQRLSDLERLAKKYGSSISEILAYAASSEKELEELAAHADTSKHLTDRLTEETGKYVAVAEKLSAKRRRDAARLEREIRREFETLAMAKMELSVRFSPRQTDKQAGRMAASHGPSGIDHVEFMIAPNSGEDSRPLTRIASGGELSRVMLAIESLCGADTGKTLVFDEVDAGIGGRVAEAVGRRLRDISAGGQVLCVTHLPQIAAFANRHFSVRKEAIGSRTETLVRVLNDTERVEELARMTGGEIITETTRRHAMEMLEHSLIPAKIPRGSHS